MYHLGDIIITNEGRKFVVDAIIPYEPSNYVWEEWLLEVHEYGNLEYDDEPPFYVMTPSGELQEQRDWYGTWTTVGTFDNDEGVGHEVD